jgi:DNA-binding NarL/FixJ family response regulator
MGGMSVFLADGHDVLRRGLRALLMTQSDFFVCGEAKGGFEAIRLISELKPGIVIVGQHLSELTGIEVMRQISKTQEAAEILFYTIHEEEHLISEALRSGARGHVLKSDSEGTLLEALAALSQHKPYFSTKAAETLSNYMRKVGNQLDATQVLTEREREITQLLACGLSNTSISRRLQVSVKTVEVRRAAIMRKLGYKSVTELVRYAIRNRLIQP